MEKIKVLFICHGNICRSTMAQYVFQNLINRHNLTDQFYIDSAATSREEIGNPIHHGTRRKLKEVGISCGDHRARQLQKWEYDEFDYLIGMDSMNIRNMMRILGERSRKEKCRNCLILQSGQGRILRIRGIPGILTGHTKM